MHTNDASVPLPALLLGAGGLIPFAALAIGIVAIIAACVFLWFYLGGGKAGKGGWSVPMPRACFGCGSTAHLMKELDSRKSRI